MLVSLLSTACGSGTPPETGSSLAVDPAPAVVTISTSTVDVILAPTVTPTPLPNTNESTEPAADSTNPDPIDSPVQADEPAAEAPTAEEAVSAAGAEASCSVEPALDFYGHPNYETLQDQLGCALNEASFEAVAINEFGAGPEFERFMLWTSTDKLIYVLRSDNSWQTHVDTWADDQPEILCNPLNAIFSSPPLPRRGFGKLWCEVDGLAEEMGLVEREERLCQHAVLQQFEHGQLLACFEDATYRYIQLMNDNSWETVFIQ